MKQLKIWLDGQHPDTENLLSQISEDLAILGSMSQGAFPECPEWALDRSQDPNHVLAQYHLQSIADLIVTIAGINDILLQH